VIPVEARDVPSDLPTDRVEAETGCARCGATTHLDDGTCLNCLLKEGLEAHGEASSQVFESVLSEAEVPDTHWRLGNYEILEEIGRGGMGVIYRAQQRHSRRIVALKRIIAYQADSHETLVRFRREAVAAASLDHPNILPIYEVSESEDGLPFFSMKFATGGNLRAAIPALHTKPDECVQLMAKVARAIAYAHGQGILHRDLQPGNILLDRNGEPMVGDFGLAKWLDENSDLTKTLTTFGTPGYIAPEQAKDAAGNITPAADIYSLGAILFHLLTGRPPFVGRNVLSVIHQAAATPAPRLRSLAPSLDRDLQTILARSLEREPKARYQTAGLLAEDLERWLEGRPILARRVHAPAHIWRWIRRNPVLSGAATACLALSAVVVWLLRGQFVLTPVLPAPEKSIAVLPFENLSRDPDNAFFTDGVQDEILTDLAKIADLKVIGRTSVMQYKSGAPRNLRAIGQQLGVALVVEGSVQREGNKVRVNAQLVDARTDAHLWVQTYDRDLADVFAIQSEIAKAIADQLQAKLSPNEKKAIEQSPTTDLAAFDLYSRAKSLLLTASFSITGEPDFRKAIELLDEAVKRDPSFFDAYCRLAYAHESLYAVRAFDHTPARLALAEAAVQAATRLRPDAAETHLARAQYLYHGLRDYAGTLAELEIARRALPNDPRLFELTGYILRRRGQQEEGLRNLERAVELDPRNLFTLQQIAISYQFLGRYAEAIAAFDRALAIVPDNVETRAGRGLFYLFWKADTRPLHQTIDAILAQGPGAIASAADTWFFCALAERDPVAAERALVALGDNPCWREPTIYLSRSFGEGLLARMTKDEARARTAFEAARAQQEKIVQTQPDYGPALCVLGLIDAALGRKDLALDEGRRAIALTPLEKDVINGSRVLQYFAITAAWAGDKELALQQLEAWLRAPYASVALSYGALKLHPLWDPLRGDPRFEELVESFAPEVKDGGLSPVAAPEKSIATLPFENITNNKESSEFVAGIQDDVLTSLAQIHDLKVISRTSVMAYQKPDGRNLREIGQELGVSQILEGSVRWAGDRVRVTAQ
jgi:TolB-like protein/Tfp pilus assembly protein PilF/tRNA A-37 threonylcarbamoyl transferase component Bud32